MNMFSTGTDFSKKTQPKNKDVKKKKNEKENPSSDVGNDQTKLEGKGKVVVLDL
jgi:hypothetical protein